MKKILFFHQSGEIGGAGLSLLHILKSIDNHEYEIVVVCPKGSNAMVEEINKLNIKVIATESTPTVFLHFNGGIKYALSTKTIVNCFNLYKDKKIIDFIINEEKPDIVAVNSMVLSHIGVIAKKYNIKTVCFDRETFQKGLFGIRTSVIKYWMTTYFDKIVFISEYDYNQVKCDKKKKILIYDKVDLGLYNLKEKTNSSSRKKVLYLGGLSKLKGIHILFKAINNINNNVEFYVVADENILNKKINIVDRINYLLGLRINSLVTVSYSKIKDKSRVHFIRATTEPEKYINNCDILVFPSTIEHQARPVFEAGAACVPVVISDFNATREFCTNEENVITFIPNNANDLANKVNKLINDPVLCEKIVHNNLELTKRKHNLSDMVDEIHNLLRDL